MDEAIKSFDFKMVLGGAKVVVVREPICSACMSDGEVDYQIDGLKTNLDVVARKMKAAIKKRYETSPRFKVVDQFQPGAKDRSAPPAR